jgi:GWxTD domain-containing protein
VNPNQENEQHIFLTDTSNTPLSRNYLPINTIARLSYKNDSVQQFYVKYFSESQNPAYPAQSQNKSFFNPLKDYDNLYIIPRGKNFSFVRRGVYFVQTDSNSNKGAFVNVVPEDYPKTTTAEDLLEALRYITTNKEYEQILNASNQKQELDNFWLQRAPNGNKEIARNQLRLYYQRVEESNFYFTSFKEGWKTDKGVIYIIFGRPHTIRKYSNKEVWYYRSNSQRPPTEFVFTRVGLARD